MSEDPLAETDADQPTRRQRLWDWLGTQKATLLQWSSDNRRAIIRTLVTVTIVAVTVVLEYLSWQYLGPVATVVYTLLFVLGLALIPSTVAVFGSMMPNLVGDIEFALGQLGFGRGWLVQHDRKWQMHPGRERDGREEVYIDGEWREVDVSGNQTILGWQPFGMLRYKDDDSLLEVRADDYAQSKQSQLSSSAVTTDGGEVVRGGYEQVPAREHKDIDAENAGEPPDSWLLDLKRIWSPGLERMGDVDVIEDVEKVKMRAEAIADQGEAKRMIIGSLVGLILGAATGYVSMAGF
jgi:hypothetical protein